MISGSIALMADENTARRTIKKLSSRDLRDFSGEGSHFSANAEAVSIPQWDLRYWQGLTGAVETFLSYPRDIFKGQLTFAATGGQGVSLEEYIELALKRAKFEEIEDDEPIYAEVPGLKGVWATGRTSDECRANLHEVIEDWVEIRKRRGLRIPPINSHTLID